MKLLLDTHFLYWLARNPAELTPAERAVFDGAEAECVISAVSVWEIRTKWQSRVRNLGREEVLDPAEALRFIAKSGYALAELTAEDCATPLGVPLAHRDPFDEQLLIHAQRLGARLLTRDRLLAGHPLVYRAA